eukprot:gene31420-40814_t
MGIVRAPKHSLLPSAMVTSFSLFTDFYPQNFTDPLCSTGLRGNMWAINSPTSCSYDKSVVDNYVIMDNIQERGVPHRHFPCKMNCGAEGENILTIFFRSGDVFTFPPPFLHYRQPPLYFYETAINSRKWQKLVFVTAASEYVNPVWKYYFEHCDDVQQRLNVDMDFLSLTSINETMTILLNAVHLVAAQSTMTSMIMDASTMVETVFCTQCDANKYKAIHLPNYFEKKLNTTEALVHWMLNYKPSQFE